MIIHTIPSGPFETNAYVLVCEKTRKAAIVDPSPDSADKISKYISDNNLHPTALLLTHSHWDHIADAAKIKSIYKIPVMIHAEDVPNLQSPGSDQIPCWIDITPITPDTLIDEGDQIQIGESTFDVIHTPGHSPGGVCFYCPEEKILISGDTLFKGTIGNISFPTSRPDLMWPSLKKLARLPKDTIVYPGHGPRTTIGTESWLDRAEELFGNR